MNIRALLIPALLAGALAVAQDDQALGDVARHYRDQKLSAHHRVTSANLQASFDIPETWTLTDSQDMSTVQCAVGSYQGQCMVSIIPGFLPADSDGFSDEDRKSIINMDKDRHVISQIDTKLGPYSVFVVDAEVEHKMEGHDPITFRGIDYYVVSAETRRTFIFELVTADEMQAHIGELRPAIESMIASTVSQKTYTRKEADALYGKKGMSVISSPKRLAKEQMFIDWMKQRTDAEATAFSILFGQGFSDSMCSAFSKKFSKEKQSPCMNDLGAFKDPVTDTRTHEKTYPQQDPNYSYQMHVVDGQREYEAIPKKSGNGGWLLTADVAYYNPNGKAEKSDTMRVEGYAGE